MEPNNGISKDNRTKVVEILNLSLADETILAMKLRKYTWNIEGRNFFEKHEFFEQNLVKVLNIVDKLAVRVRMLGDYPVATLQKYVDMSRLSEDDEGQSTEESMVRDLLDCVEKMITQYREDIDNIKEMYSDSGTASLLTEIMREHESQGLALRSMLEE
jgi:starvation-inducible DNA-binding protein